MRCSLHCRTAKAASAGDTTTLNFSQGIGQSVALYGNSALAGTPVRPGRSGIVHLFDGLIVEEEAGANRREVEDARREAKENGFGAKG